MKAAVILGFVLAAAPGLARAGDAPEKQPAVAPAPAAGAAPNLVKNGDFSAGKDSPDNWSKMDNLSTFWVAGGPDADGKKSEGKCLKIDTDIYLKEWEEQRKSMEAGKPGAPKSKTPTTGDKYDTVGGTKGVAVYSDEIEVQPGASYKLSVAVRSAVKSTDLFFPKVFVKGYAEVNGEMRETYNTYLACRLAGDGRWQSFERVFHPTKNTPAVKKMKVMIYAYWPPGVYQFDDVRIEEVREEAK